MAVVDQYIVEQTKKSAEGLDIPKFSRYDFSEGAVLTFAGLKTVEGQTLLLLQSTRGIEVMPASPEMVRRLGRRAIGTVVQLTAAGELKRGGRSQ